MAVVVGEKDVSGGAAMTVAGDLPPLPVRAAIASLTRCVGRSLGLLARREVHQPTDSVGDLLRFGDGSHSHVYRETTLTNTPTDQPVVLVVAFRLRGVRGRGHALFRAESLLNTPLFVGFPGFVSKLWLTHDEHGRYRGLYQWDGAARAHAYVRALWWVLAVVSHRASIRYVVVPGVRRDELLANPALLDEVPRGEGGEWWRLVSVEGPDG
jgi:hypothetical protein